MYKKNKTNRQIIDVTREKKQESSFFAAIHEKKTNCFIHTHTDIDIFTYKLFFSFNNHHLFRMYHVVRCHYCYVYHSQLGNYPFDDHDHAHVIDVLLNLDVRVMYDAHYDVQLNVNVFDLDMKN